MTDRLRELAERLQRRSRAIRTAIMVVGSTRRRLKNLRGYDGNDGGRRHSGKLDIETSVQYVEAQFETYARAIADAGHQPSFGGNRVLEVGPGDTNAVAIMFVAAGAEEVVCVDRFRPERDSENDQRLCRAVFERFDASAYGLPEPAVDLTYAQAYERVSYHHGLPLEEAAVDGSLGPFDLVVSNAVLEHVYDLDACFEAMDTLLVPDGLLVHLVDLRDHGLYSSVGQHPLTHLTLRGSIYRFISKPSGAPNRALAPTYRSILSTLGYDHSIAVTHLLFDDGATAADIKRYHPDSTIERMGEVRDRLATEFVGFSDDDLNTAGISLVAARAAL